MLYRTKIELLLMVTFTLVFTNLLLTFNRNQQNSQVIKNEEQLNQHHNFNTNDTVKLQTMKNTSLITDTTSLTADDNSTSKHLTDHLAPTTVNRINIQTEKEHFNHSITHSDTNQKNLLEISNTTKPMNNISHHNNVSFMLLTSDGQLKKKNYPINITAVNKFRYRDQTDLHKRPYVILASQIGRLGNQLFQYAMSYSLAMISNNHKPALKKDSELLPIFGSLAAEVINAKDAQYRDMLALNEKSAGKFSPELQTKIISKHITGHVNLCCYFQSWRYFMNYEKQLRRQLTVKAEIQSQVHSHIHVIMKKHIKVKYNNGAIISNKILLPQLLNNFTYIGVHVRISDMNAPHMNKRGYTAAPLSYIHNAMNYYRKKFTNPVFLVCSDDIKWCKNNVVTSNSSQQYDDIVFVERRSGSHVLDFATLVSCNHSIITSGTFGWWAGWLAGGQVVYYSGFPIPGTEIGNQYNSKDYYPPHWIPMM